MDFTHQPIDLTQFIKQLNIINETKTENNKSFRSTVGIKQETGEEIENIIEMVLVTVKDKKYMIAIEQPQYAKETGDGTKS